MRARNIIRRTIWTFIALATLIALFYAEEDWRGARAWQSAQAEYKKAGESLDYARFIPPPIPDSQNLGALPLFALTPGSKEEPYPHPAALEKALRQGERPDLFLIETGLGSAQRGERPDLKQIRQGVAAMYASIFKGALPPPTAFAQFEASFPFIAGLREASSTRPYCRFNAGYPISPPFDRAVALITDQIQVAKVLNVDAILALDAHQPEAALADLRTLFILRAGCKNDSMMGSFVAIGLDAIGGGAVAEGLALHAWNDAQLAQLQRWYGQIDFLAGGRFAIRSETASYLLRLNYLNRHPQQPFTLDDSPNNPRGYRVIGFYPPWPVGWVDDDRTRIVLFALDCLASVDPKAGRVYVDRVHRLTEERNQTAVLGHYAVPWNVYYFYGTMGFDYMPFSSAYAQARADFAILACGLERYRLAHGNYPATLDALRPDNCAEIPNDVINGQPYHYRVLPDGSYRLYSVGWNEKDDGGTLAMKTKYGRQSIDYDQGDWVWFGAK